MPKKVTKTKAKTKVKTKGVPSLAELEEITGSKERTLFYLTWLKHERNATKAYLQLHPDVTKDSARSLGARMLANVNIELIAQAYGLNHELYFNQLFEGVVADKWNDFTGEREPDHKTRKAYHDKLGVFLGLESNTKATGISVTSTDGDKEITVKILDYKEGDD